MQDATFNQDFCGALINYQLKKPPSVSHNVPMPPFWGPEDASIMLSLINVEITEEKNVMPLDFKEAHLYNGYMSMWAKLTPYGMENT